MSAPIIQTRSDSQWTFTQGLILGQASFLVLSLLFVRYVVFSPADKGDSQAWKKRRDERAKKALLSERKVPPPTIAQLIGKTNYEMATHPAETTDWLNVLFAQVMQGYRNDLLSAGGEEGARLKVEKWLNPSNGAMSWLDPITVTGISLGTAYPLFSNARIRPADGQGHLRAEIDMDYSDSLSLSLSTSVLVNFPRPRFAVLPVALGVELASIGGTLSVQVHDPVEGKQHLHVCLLPDFHLDLRTTSLLGSRAKLQDIPKLEQLLLSRIRSLIQDRFVHPKTISVSLPRLLVGESPMSSKEFIAELGEEAKEVMGQAVRQGLGQIVSDLGLGGDLLSPDANGKTTRSASMQPSTRTSSVNVKLPPSISVNTMNRNRGDANPVTNGAGPSRTTVANAGIAGTNGEKSSPASPISPRIGRKIPMPAGFPYSNPSTSDEPTPLQTPLPAGRFQPQTSYIQPPSRAAQSAQQSGLAASTSGYQPAPSVSASAYSTQRNAPSAGVGGGAINGHLPYEPRSRSDSFRFRGQFASQPATPGMSEVDPGGRRVGALNSRAG